jgi:leucyl aminopeptidase (aminopeptidase T)
MPRTGRRKEDEAVETVQLADVVESAHLIIHTLLGVKPGEQVLLIADTQSDVRMAHALAGEILAANAEFTLAVMPARDLSRANELSPVVVHALEAANVVIGLTRSCGAPTYHPTVAHLLKSKRTRNLSMVMRDATHWTRGGARADYRHLRAEGELLRKFWAQRQTAQITTPLGTDLVMSIQGPPVIVECGFALEPGEEAAFPDGEVSQMPVEGTTEGILVIDGPICHIGVPEEPIRLEVHQGRVRSIAGKSFAAARLREIVRTIANADNIAELGIGLNPASQRSGDFEEEKKARGTIHVALGSNVFYGGTVHSEVHIDMVIYRATVTMDGVAVVRDGELHLPEGSHS